MRSLLSALIALLILAFAPAAAQAGTVAVSGATLSFTAGDAETNNVNVSLSAGTYTVADSGAAVTPGAGCSAAGRTSRARPPASPR